MTLSTAPRPSLPVPAGDTRLETGGSRWPSGGRAPVVRPGPEAAAERVGVVAEPCLRRQLAELHGIAAADHDRIGLERRAELRDRLGDELAPALVAALQASPLADVVLVGVLLEG